MCFTNNICGLASADTSLECGENRSMKFAWITGRFVTPQDHFFAAAFGRSLPDTRANDFFTFAVNLRTLKGVKYRFG